MDDVDQIKKDMLSLYAQIKVAQSHKWKTFELHGPEIESVIVALELALEL